MERIEYGKAVFNVSRTLRFERTRVTDAANNYLHHHVDALVEVHWHPTQVAYGINTPGGAPFALPGAMPGQTDLALLAYLLQPRAQLRIIAGNSIILDTPVLLPGVGPPELPGVPVDPKRRYPCDVMGGPSIEAVGVPMMVGIKHWFVTLHIVADVRDTVWVLNSTQNAVLSNLWVCTEDIDRERRSVRRFAGRAILRADVLRSKNINANSLRDLYLFKCPNHYQRQNVSVQISEDGRICDWSFEDAMRGYDLGLGAEIIDIECFATGNVSRKSLLNWVFETARGITRAGSIPGAVMAPIAATLNNLPVSHRQARCDLTGDRNADLGRLSSIAMGICAHRIGSFDGQILTGTMDITFRQDVADKVYTSVEMSTLFTDDMILGTQFQANLPANWAGLIGQLEDNLAAVVRVLTLAYQQDSRKVVSVFQVVGGRAGAGDGRNAIFAPGGGFGAAPPVEAPRPVLVETIFASRQGDRNFQDNPPLRQGAFGVVPQTTPGLSNIPPSPGAFGIGAFPTGAIPAGIEHMIVQAILGQNQLPPKPDTLTLDS